MTETRSYYGRPIIKPPTWTWEVPCYLFSGGLAGASAGLAYLAELRGEPECARRSWAIAMAGIAASPPLLIADLGRPGRFHHMMRMFKVTSPMSVGSWILSVSGTTTAIAAAHAWLGLFPRLSRVARPLAAAFGLPLSTYTAALLTNTAVPVWHEARTTMPFVFAAGAGLSAGASAVIAAPADQAAAARRLAVAGSVVELAAETVMKRRLGQHARPYDNGAPARFEQLARGALVAGAALVAGRGGRSRALASAGAGLVLVGALATRWSVYKAGFASVSDPEYVVGPQRDNIVTGARPGAARIQPRAAAAGAST